MGAFADGAPATKNARGGWTTSLDTGMDAYPAMTVPPELGAPQPRLPERRRKRYVEGPRWVTVRVTVWLRYLAYFLSVLLCSALTQGLLAGVPTARNGGQWMLFSVGVLMLAAAFGLWRYPTHREEIVRQARHYIFGIMVLPGTAIAAVMWAAGQFFTDAAATSGVFGSMMATALPIVFFITVVLPVLIYVKLVAGMRYMYRSTEDDQETMSVYTRQDQLHR